jgi:drug/metabolite transporter (DMT)-like permease
MGTRVTSASSSLLAGRLYVVLAALFWSTSGAFTKLLTQETGTGLNVPPVHALHIAFFRVLFGGLALVPFVRRADLSFRPATVGTVASFALMNAMFVWSMAAGTAANAILLQYTAPMWMYLASVWWLGEPADRRAAVSLVIGLCGIAVIVLGGWQGGQLKVVAIALGSGVTYAGVMIGLRMQRDASPTWLTVINHLGGAALLLPWVVVLPLPGLPQLVVLFFFGTLQMGLPYWLVARGLRTVSPQEAGTLTLLEPLLNPLWAYLVSPATEGIKLYTLIGGTCILGALAYRYWPFSPATKGKTDPQSPESSD